MSNLVLAVLGAGQLTLPYAMGQLGLGFGLLSLLVFTGLSMLSLHTLSVYELHFTPGPADCLESYAELVVRVLGGAGSRICTALLALYAWGGALSFMVILKVELGFLLSLLPPAQYAAVSDGAAAAAAAPGSVLLALVAGLFIWPLSSLEDLSGLKKFSPLGCIAAIFITCVVLRCTPWGLQVPTAEEVCRGPAGESSSGSLKWWPTAFMDVAAALPLLAFALNSSWAYIPILCTLRDKTGPRVGSLIASSNAIILTNYLLLAIGGYAMFCNGTAPNILDSLGGASLPSAMDGTLVVLARAALALQLTLALPMRFFVARRTVGGDSPGSAGRVLLAGALVASATVLAIMPLSLATVLGLTSSVCASMIIYILPAVVDLRVRLPGKLRMAGSVLSLLVGLFVLVAGLAANVMGVAVGS